MTALPTWRPVSRLVVIDPADWVLLLRAHDPDDSTYPDHWEIPGGGVESSEDPVRAAIREVAEETGYQVPVEAGGPVCWTGYVTYRWRLRERHSRMVIRRARVGELTAAGEPSLTADEEGTFLGVHWVPVGDLANEAVFPVRVGDLSVLLADGRIDAGHFAWTAATP